MKTKKRIRRIKKKVSEKKHDFLIEQLAKTKSIFDFSFSHDDKEIYFVSNLGEYFRVWTMPTGGGFPRLVSIINRGDVKKMRLSPDGKTLAFCCDIAGAENHRIYVIPSTGGEPRCISEKVKVPWWHFCWSNDSKKIAVIGQKDKTYNVAALDVENGDVEWLTDTTEMKMGVTWSFDGQWVAYTSFSKPLESHIKIVNTESLEIRSLTETMEGENSDPHFNPRNNNVAFTSDARGIKNVVILNIEGRSAYWMQQTDYEQGFLTWNGDGTHFAFYKNEDSEMTIHESNYPPTVSRRLTTTGFTGSDVEYARGSNTVAIKLSTPTQPSDLYIRKHKTLRKLTESAVYGFPSDRFSEPRKVKYPSFDDKMIPALYYTPKDAIDYPVVIWIHGGPTGQHMNSWNPTIQLFIANGIAVLAPNIRGSTGYGKEFENLNYHDWGGADMKDVVAAIDFIESDFNCDPDKIIIAGGSYGGYMTMMAITRYPDLWAAGINIVGPVNLETMYKNTTPWAKMILEQKYGFKDPGSDPSFYYNRSPINFVDKIQCPVLLMYGKNDPRVPVGEMYQLKKALVKHKKVFEEELFATEGHSKNRTSTRITQFEKMVEFIKKHIMK